LSFSTMFVAKTNMPEGFYKPLGFSGIIGQPKLAASFIYLKAIMDNVIEWI
jgi:hypothetical protein